MKQPAGAHGLLNPEGANNCFLNVCIQVLYHLAPFRIPFLSNESHTCSGESCVFCALQEIFKLYEFSAEQHLPPDYLRNALAILYNQKSKFRLGELDDPVDALNSILNAVHLAAGCPADLACNPPCASHFAMAMDLLEGIECTTCAARTEPVPFRTFTFDLSVREILDIHAKYYRKYTFEQLAYMNLGGRKPCPQERSKCLGPARVTHTFMGIPPIITMTLAWYSEAVPLADLRLLFDLLPDRILLNSMNLLPHDHPPVYAYLRAMICYYGKHYDAFCYSGQTKEWLAFDDTIRRALSGHVQPALLFFEADLPKDSPERANLEAVYRRYGEVREYLAQSFMGTQKKRQEAQARQVAICQRQLAEQHRQEEHHEHPAAPTPASAAGAAGATAAGAGAVAPRDDATAGDPSPPASAPPPPTGDSPAGPGEVSTATPAAPEDPDPPRAAMTLAAPTPATPTPTPTPTTAPTASVAPQRRIHTSADTPAPAPAPAYHKIRTARQQQAADLRPPISSSPLQDIASTLQDQIRTASRAEAQQQQQQQQQQAGGGGLPPSLLLRGGPVDSTGGDDAPVPVDSTGAVATSDWPETPRSMLSKVQQLLMPPGQLPVIIPAVITPATPAARTPLPTNPTSPSRIPPPSTGTGRTPPHPGVVATATPTESRGVPLAGSAATPSRGAAAIVTAPLPQRHAPAPPVSMSQTFPPPRSSPVMYRGQPVVTAPEYFDDALGEMVTDLSRLGNRGPQPSSPPTHHHRHTTDVTRVPETTPNRPPSSSAARMSTTSPSTLRRTASSGSGSGTGGRPTSSQQPWR
ncbi:putative Inactive ubiquitin carboxyl-terminal hydrolase 54 [Paratrimastix pyriformis]|uniref:Inactive ubiquitin carboxyl-terminal hydrolase 54 n=1 Tax=Paratrimastix pyriformis TaxID=342808 RepID=A0ABQ8UR38_9EUKA|nr:putative Inactive ubiquitin carboxyl-terminal hydrolase 54 [Paratrimastix pyriformis]